MSAEEDFRTLLHDVTPLDRDWIESEAQEIFIQIRSALPSLDVLQLDRAWTRALWTVALSPTSRDPMPSPDQYHRYLSFLLGDSGSKLLRLRKQEDFVSIPWIERHFLESSRVALYDYFRSQQTLTLQETDRFWAERHALVVARQLITVFACDYRGEHQRDLLGAGSLRAGLLDPRDIDLPFSRLEALFAGREDELEKAFLYCLRRPLEPEEMSAWFLLSARDFCAEYDCQGEVDLGGTLLQCFWKVV